MENKGIPWACPDFGLEEKQAIHRVVDSGWMTMGEETAKLEAELATVTKERDEYKHALKFICTPEEDFCEPDCPHNIYGDGDCTTENCLQYQLDRAKEASDAKMD